MAFLTGSFAYGEPHAESDVDLVVHMPREAELELRRALDVPEYGPIRCGKLNLIVCNNEGQFAAWRYATDTVATTTAGQLYREQVLAKARKDFLRNDDGFIVWFPAFGQEGYLTADALRVIADELDRLNAAWAAELDRYFAEQETKMGQVLTFVGLVPPDGQYGCAVERGSHHVQFTCPGPDGKDHTYGGNVPQPIDGSRVDVNVVNGVGEVIAHP